MIDESMPPGPLNDQKQTPSHANDPPRRVIKIGSQRDEPVSAPTLDSGTSEEGVEASTAVLAPAATPETPPPSPSETDQIHLTRSPSPFPPPRINRDSEELQREIDAALSGRSFEEILATPSARVRQGNEPEIDQRYRASIVKIHHDDVFLVLPSNHEAVVPFRSFVQEPRPGEMVDVIVTRWNRDDNLYHCRLAGSSVEVVDWSDLEEGSIVEARITGHNAGGLECEVNRIRGFIPVSQVALYRVEQLEDFVGQRLLCLVTEANASRGNLVLSRRAVEEREREENRKVMLESMEPGQIREGVVRGIKDFGAFVDLGGVDGLIHISKLSWDRVKHPSEVVEEGQRVKVKVEKLDPVTGKISLSYRDLVEQPWDKVQQSFVLNTVVPGTVSRITDFGAFVKLAPGIEGLVHISELANHRVSRVSSVVQVGQEVQVKILSVDSENQRMSLSMKQAAAPAQTEPTAEEPAAELSEQTVGLSVRSQDRQSLRGGTDRRTGGEKFGLKW